MTVLRDGGAVFKPLALVVVMAGTAWTTVLAVRPVYQGVRAGYADENYLPSSACVACHVDHHASWARTYHSRMTREARPATMQGDFERDNVFEYLGVRARMERRGDAFVMTFNFPDGRAQSFTVDRTVGSRRIEQYLTKQHGQYTRLPLAYDLTDRRWMSLNGSFFYPDGDDYFQHQAAWDLNCVFCHNVKAQPHFDVASRQYRAETEVSELGIACGACHGPAARHAQAASSPLTRTLWRLQSDPPTHIVNPLELDAERSMMVCGHCHGQRLPDPTERLAEILGRGDPFNPGDDLSKYFKPVSRETTIGSHALATRFWPNGSPRLTAYEYQGVLHSRCFTDGDVTQRINCLTCHTMHAGDPKGQITKENRTDEPCLTCHRQYRTVGALAEHTGHDPESIGSRCYACHMPRVVYGVMAVHPSHEITVPAPSLTVTDGMPNACNQCHLDRSVNWAIRESKRLWPERYGAATASGDSQFELPEGPRACLRAMRSRAR